MFGGVSGGAQPLRQALLRDLANPFGTSCFCPLFGPVRVCFEQDGRRELAHGYSVLRCLVHPGFPAPVRLYSRAEKPTLATGLRQREITAGVFYRGKKAQDFVELGQLKKLLRQRLRPGHP
jgi:hypothetical protein